MRGGLEGKLAQRMAPMDAARDNRPKSILTLFTVHVKLKELRLWHPSRKWTVASRHSFSETKTTGRCKKALATLARMKCADGMKSKQRAGGRSGERPTPWSYALPCKRSQTKPLLTSRTLTAILYVGAARTFKPIQGEGRARCV
jgi:hypothetical protein